MPDPFISILVLVHNAPRYTERAIRSVKHATSVPHELVVLDNASEEPTRALLRSLRDEGLIDVLVELDFNSLFAEGNNRAAAAASPRATHYLLLNSDVEVRSTDWIENLLQVHRRGATAYGIATDPLRVDGYCLLIDADLYRKYPLDESHQWFWAVTKTQAALLAEGHAVQGFAQHRRYLHHYGGKSGSAFADARGMDVTRDEVESWFQGREPYLIDRRPDGSIPGHGHRLMGFRRRTKQFLGMLRPSSRNAS